MKIGLIAYPTVPNFGANLQILSTLEYYRKRNIDIEIINWLPYALEKTYSGYVPAEQHNAHKDFWDKYYTISEVCRTSEDVAKLIEKENITAVIVGSDAVAQHHPFLTRIIFPCRRIIVFPKYSDDRMFPNVFWGDFEKYLKKEIPLAVLSASSQNAPYKSFERDVKRQMKDSVKKYKYLSVRDKWTQNLYSYVTDGEIVPPITPDPVFAFNYNVDFVPSKEEILKKYNLPEKYIIVAFYNKIKVKDEWMKKFVEIVHSHNYKTVALPFPNKLLFENLTDYKVELPLDPLDWYAIIKYAAGYVGHNMHPIVICLHNSVPFYSFDNYGIQYLRLFYNKKSSKIYDILKRSGFENYRCNATLSTTKNISPENVFNRLKEFDREKCSNFASSYYASYDSMMSDITNLIS